MATLNIEFNAIGSEELSKKLDNVERSLSKNTNSVAQARAEAIKFASILKGSLAESLNNSKIRTEGLKQANIDAKTALVGAQIDATKLASALKSNLATSLNTAKIQTEGFRQANISATTSINNQKVETETYRTALAKTRAELAQLSLETRKSKQNVDIAAGSYREAQVRLTTLGQAIRNTAGGFNTSNPAVQRQIVEYRNLNNQLKAFDKQMGNNFRNVGNYGSALSALSPQLGLVTTGLGGFVAAGLAVRSAYNTLTQFDSGMRNVEKTTGLARREIVSLGQEFIKLSRQLQTVSATKLTEYATVAGQLGVKGTQNILNFSEALAKLETASDITGENGGAEIARLLTLTDGGVQNIRKFSDEIVNLGNNFPATEREILANAEAIAQNVGIYRIGRQEVLAFATATKSVGIEAELVGSTFNRTLAIFEKSIRTGGNLNTVLKLVGGTQEELSRRFKTDASGVFIDFISSLNKIYKEGGSVNEQLEKIGVNAVRDQRVIQSLAANGYDVLTRSLGDVRDAIGAADAEFETASNKLINQTGRIKIAWENLVLSVEDGSGKIGRGIVILSDSLATILEGITNIVTSKQWNEFFARWGELSGDGITRSLSRAAGDALRFQNDNPNATRGDLVPYKDLRDFYKSSRKDQEAMLKAQEELVKFKSKEYQLDKSISKLNDLNYNAERLAKMRAEIAEPIEVLIEPTLNKNGGGGLSAKQKKEAESVAEKLRKSLQSIGGVFNPQSDASNTRELKGLDEINKETENKYQKLYDNLDKIREDSLQKLKGNQSEIAQIEKKYAAERTEIQTAKEFELSQNEIDFAERRDNKIAELEQKANINRQSSRERDLQSDKIYWDKITTQADTFGLSLEQITEYRRASINQINTKWDNKALADAGKIQDRIRRIEEKPFSRNQTNDQIQVELDKRLAQINDFYNKIEQILSGNNIKGIPRLLNTFNRYRSLATVQSSGSESQGELSRFVTRSFRVAASRGLDDVFNQISGIGQSTYDIEEKYNKLRQDASDEQIKALERMRRLERQINNGLGNLFTSLTSTFGQLGSQVLTRGLGESISTGDFSTFKNLFKGDNKNVGIGASIATFGNVLSGLTSPTSGLGKALGGLASGAGAGFAVGGPIGAIVGGVVGAIGGIFSASQQNKQRRLEEEQLAEQRRTNALLERQNALAFTSQIIGQKTVNGIVSGVDRNEFGEIEFTIQGRQLKAVLDRENQAQNRGL